MAKTNASFKTRAGKTSPRIKSALSKKEQREAAETQPPSPGEPAKGE